ncbi:cysteine synthase A [Parageobacillus thermoglucosidasius]|jgi:cysteine synthase A|uniref:Cysteine synthase n=3 Tax=Anoxybacillaceae TaxID=3120669 RepID=A0AAN0YPT3_PARTM|nr:cysteine synthase A [Parageobacillus thermoglucosidasius]KYD16786.1 Cysteine synthase [Anoxybacillus flavithermus]REK58124.1 MAG: cysteine synthase A [Geobacillus sp.]AEH47674.1 cysteine synthase [Parageobacillus thermoglucosidasius C56-YS93]ALF11079.1 cysteine synthase [Parageobacillus thermoglucosidasius]ANZ31157.1 cysteine synthase A [Parageobacillus thermoglucosidasius]
MKLYNSVLDLIGNTPIVQLNKIPDPHGADVYMKLESFNPGGSVKDRAAFEMIRRAEQEGKIVPGKSTIIEPTSGNTGIGLAMVCAAKGYRCIITMPDNATAERVKILKAYGAEVHLTPAEKRMKGAIDEANRLAAQIPDSFIPMQFENPANPDAHRHSTAREILEAFDGQLDAFVLTAGTGGTVTGTGEELKKRIPNLRIYVVEPYGSPVLSGGKPGPHKIPGTGPGFIPKILNRHIYDDIFLIKDEDAQMMARRLAAEEGILVGASAAASAFYAIKVAKQLPKGARVLCMAPDSGERYLSSDLFAE